MGRVEVLLRSDDRPAIGMRRREQGRLQKQVRRAVRPVLVALAPLVLHHVPLNVEPLLVERVQQEAHPVRLQPQRHLQVVGRHGLPVVGLVGARGPVDGAPDLLKGLEVERLWFFDPSNMTCSNRWAKPVRPASSFLDPTWYQRLTPTVGSAWSSWSTTCRPLDSVNF